MSNFAPALAVSTVIFTLRPNPQGNMQLALALVRRVREPFEGLWALPGGPLEMGEGLADAAAHNLLETTGLEPRYLEQLYAFGELDRSQAAHNLENAERVVSIVYWALVGSAEAAKAIESENVSWFWADNLEKLAFDHNLIVDYALWRLRNKLEYSRLAHGFLSERFTLAQLREVYEAVLGKELDPGNFRRMVEANGAVLATGEKLEGTRHRPPQLYRYDDSVDLADHGPLNFQQQTATLKVGERK